MRGAIRMVVERWEEQAEVVTRREAGGGEGRTLSPE